MKKTWDLTLLGPDGKPVPAKLSVSGNVCPFPARTATITRQDTVNSQRLCQRIENSAGSAHSSKFWASPMILKPTSPSERCSESRTPRGLTRKSTWTIRPDAARQRGGGVRPENAELPGGRRTLSKPNAISSVRRASRCLIRVNRPVSDRISEAHRNFRPWRMIYKASRKNLTATTLTDAERSALETQRATLETQNGRDALDNQPVFRTAAPLQRRAAINQRLAH